MALLEQVWLALLVSIGESAPFVLLGLLVAGLVREFVPASALGRFRRWTCSSIGRSGRSNTGLFVQYDPLGLRDGSRRCWFRHRFGFYDECPSNFSCNCDPWFFVTGARPVGSLFGSGGHRLMPYWASRKRSVAEVERSIGFVKVERRLRMWLR